MSIHNCDLIESFCMDERVPVELRKDRGEFVLFVNADTPVTMAYCPFCGDSLVDDRHKSDSVKAGVCDHIKDLAARPESSVRYLPNESEYFIIGAEDLQVRLFFCPICGEQLPLHETNCCQKSDSEIADLTKLFANVSSADQAIEQVGAPDFEDGPVQDHFYWKGERLAVGYRRCLRYERLANTVDVQVVEWSDGRFDVKFLAKGIQPGSA